MYRPLSIEQAGHRTMLTSEQDDSVYRVRHSNYVIPLALLCLPPLLLVEHWAGLLDGSLEKGELIGLVIGILMPLLAAYYFIEFSSFEFATDSHRFSWRWRNLFKSSSGEVSLDRVANIRCDALESGDSAGRQYSHRLMVILDDGTMIPLTRRFSALYGKKLEQITRQIREHIGHNTSMP